MPQNHPARQIWKYPKMDRRITYYQVPVCHTRVEQQSNEPRGLNSPAFGPDMYIIYSCAIITRSIIGLFRVVVYKNIYIVENAAKLQFVDTVLLAETRQLAFRGRKCHVMNSRQRMLGPPPLPPDSTRNVVIGRSC